jgi:Fe-S cluster assembly protein SufD
VTEQKKEKKETMSESKAANTIARERVDNIATRNSEPAWLKDLRLSAWERYLQTAMPEPREEEWRKIELGSLHLSELKAIDWPGATGKEGKPSKLPQYFADSLSTFENAGVVAETCAQHWNELSEKAAKQGVIFCSLKSAVEKHQDKVKPYLEKTLTKDGKFTLMNQALFNTGAFLYVPNNVEVDLPFLSMIHLDAEAMQSGVAVFPRVVVVLGANSKATLMASVSTEEAAGNAAAHLSLCDQSVEVHLAQGAKLQYIELHKLSDNTFGVLRNHYDLARDASLYSLTVGLGGAQIKSDINTVLGAPGAHCDIEGVVFGDGSEHFSFNTCVDHDAPDTKSNINFRVALKDSASSVYLGTIKVAKVAQKTDSFQSNKNLLLGSDAKADSIPKLEILADDVKCSHGATVGPVDKEQIFYLQSRGLTEPEAEELVVTGFFKQIFDTCALPGAADYISELLANKMQGND